MKKEDSQSPPTVVRKLKSILEILNDKRKNWHGMYSLSTSEINKLYSLHEEALDIYQEELIASKTKLKLMENKMKDLEDKVIGMLDRTNALEEFDA